jgi:glycerophosphoryl diester phosphodiesterase
MKFQIEMKTDPSLDPGQYGDPKLMAEKLVKIIEAEGIVDRVEVQAFDFRCMLAVKALNPKIALQFLSWNPSKYQWRDPDPEVAGLWTAGELLVNHGNSIPQLIKDMGGTVWGVQDTGLEKAMLDRAKELGLRVIVWSLPSYPDTEINVRLTETLIAWGVDGFITDRPDIIRGLLAARGHYHFPPSCSEARPCK